MKRDSCPVQATFDLSERFNVIMHHAVEDESNTTLVSFDFRNPIIHYILVRAVNGFRHKFQLA